MNLADCANVMQIMGVVVAVGAVIVAYRQWKHDKLFKRNAAIRDILREMHSNPDTNRFLHDVDYGVKWYDENFHNSERERHVDVALHDLNYICYLFRMGLIEEDELKLAQYELSQCLRNPQTQKYLAFISNFANGRGVKCPFAELIQYGLKINLLDEKNFNK